MFLTLLGCGKNVPYIDGLWEELFLTLVVSGKHAPYIGGQWEECSLHWWSAGTIPSLQITKKITVVSGYISDSNCSRNF
ncbi:unnamed protein product [Staurois parvus]|uniref:Uncharacterized protein n=1 Tax=Staurois parvus TaxID=386267 RepID=A0ABN9G4P7_9NEOB|nr:unnamed protein product [Staurois parvus]